MIKIKIYACIIIYHNEPFSHLYKALKKVIKNKNSIKRFLIYEKYSFLKKDK